MKKDKLTKVGILLFFIIIICIGSYFNIEKDNKEDNTIDSTIISYEISNIPSYSGEIYIEINNNIPEFTEEDMNIVEDYYSDLENGKVRNGYDKN
jgi:hypothetical protein